MNIFIACSSSEEIPKKYFEKSFELLNEIFKKENDLVFGAYYKGIMNDAYKIALENKRKITGIVPEKYIDDAKNLKLNKKIVTKDIVSRGQELLKNSDICIFLPGGLGTILELSMALDKKRNGEIDSKIIIFNEFNFFDGYLENIKKIFDEKFTNEKFKEIFFVSKEVSEIIEYIEENKTKEK